MSELSERQIREHREDCNIARKTLALPADGFAAKESILQSVLKTDPQALEEYTKAAAEVLSDRYESLGVDTTDVAKLKTELLKKQSPQAIIAAAELVANPVAPKPELPRKDIVFNKTRRLQ